MSSFKKESQVNHESFFSEYSSSDRISKCSSFLRFIFM